jgi:hypothetical protein
MLNHLKIYLSLFACRSQESYSRRCEWKTAFQLRQEQHHVVGTVQLVAPQWLLKRAPGRDRTSDHRFRTPGCNFLHPGATMKRLVSIRASSHPRYGTVVYFRQGGKRQTRYFVSNKDAKAFAQDKQIELLNVGRKHGELTAEERRTVTEAREIAEAMREEGFRDFSLRKAVEHYAAHLRTLRTSKTVGRGPRVRPGPQFLRKAAKTGLPIENWRCRPRRQDRPQKRWARSDEGSRIQIGLALIETRLQAINLPKDALPEK